MIRIEITGDTAGVVRAEASTLFGLALAGAKYEDVGAAELADDAGGKPGGEPIENAASEPARRTRRTKAEMEAARAAEAAAKAGPVVVGQTATTIEQAPVEQPKAPEPDIFDTKADAGAPKAYTQADAMAILQRIASAQGMDAARTKLAECGAKKLSELTPDMLQAFCSQNVA